MERFKSLEQMFEVDPRNKMLVKGDHSSVTFEDYYNLISVYELHEEVPEELRSRFNTIKNLAVFSWADYSQCMTVTLQCFILLEWALKKKVELEGISFSGSFKNHMDKAISENWVNDQAFSHYEYDPSDPQAYCRGAFDIVRGFRNDMAHGSSSLFNDHGFTLQWVSEFINFMFK